jgi:hypothetical protein
MSSAHYRLRDESAAGRRKPGKKIRELGRHASWLAVPDRAAVQRQHRRQAAQALSKSMTASSPLAWFQSRLRGW